MRFARWIFGAAGVWGIVVLLPGYFFERQYGQDYPPPVNHPEFYYGFFGVALAWQLMFLVIAREPVRYRLAMIPAMLEKVSFAVAIPLLFAAGRVNTTMLAGAATDAVWLVLFIAAFLRTPSQCRTAAKSHKCRGVE